MKTKFNLKQLDELTPKRALTLAIIAVVVVVVVWIFWEKISTAISSYIAKKKQQKEDIINFGTPTATTDFDTLAVQIYNAMKGWGTNEEAVERVLMQIKSNADWAALRLAYQKVNRDSEYNTLDARIGYEGTSAELKKWRAILATNGVTIYQF